MLSAMLYSGSKIRSAKRASLAGALAILTNSLADGSLVSTDLLLVQPQVLTVLAACDPLMLIAKQSPSSLLWCACSSCLSEVNTDQQTGPATQLAHALLIFPNTWWCCDIIVYSV